jgi:hypothetical protein
MDSVLQVAGCLLLTLGLTIPFSGTRMDDRTRLRVRAVKMFSVAALLVFVGSLVIHAIGH